MITLRHMEVIHALMVTGSVTSAARLLNVTQPAVSSTLRHCEDQLKMRLFHRTRGRLHPTDEARAVYPDISEIYDRIESVRRISQDLAGGRIGTFSIAAAFPIANGFLPEAIAQFVATRPDVRFSLQSVTTPDVVARLINREVELGFGHEPVSSDSVDSEELTSWQMGCVVAADHPLARRNSVTLEELADQPLITYLPHIIFRPLLERAFNERGIEPNIVGQVSIALTGLLLARHGAGVALIDSHTAETLNFPEVKLIPLVPPISAKTLVLTRRDNTPSLIAREFMQHVRKILADESHDIETAMTPAS